MIDSYSITIQRIFFTGLWGVALTLVIMWFDYQINGLKIVGWVTYPVAVIGTISLLATFLSSIAWIWL